MGLVHSPSLVGAEELQGPGSVVHHVQGTTAGVGAALTGPVPSWASAHNRDLPFSTGSLWNLAGQKASYELFLSLRRKGPERPLSLSFV